MATSSSDRCSYQSSSCPHPRAIKENGERHRLCDFHRDKANEAQRLWHSRHGHRKRRARQRNEPYKRRSCAHLKALATASSGDDDELDLMPGVSTPIASATISQAAANEPTAPTVDNGAPGGFDDQSAAEVEPARGRRDPHVELDELLALIVDHALSGMTI